MKSKIIIKPLNSETTNNSFVTSYPIEGGKIRVWGADDKIYEVNSMDKLPAKKMIIFDNQVKKYEFVFENDSELKLEYTDYSKQLEKIYNVFLLNNPTCYINGQPHTKTKNPIFNIIDVNKDIAEKQNKFQLNLKAANMVNDMNEIEREDVLYYYGSSPKNKNPYEILMELGDFQEGYCIRDAEKFINKWASEKEEITFIVSIRRALDDGIIEERKEGLQKSFYIDKTWLGITFGDILDFMKKNPKIYNDHVLRLINEKKQLKNDIIQKEKTELEDAEKNIEDLRDEVKKYIEKGYLESVPYWKMQSKKLLPLVDMGRRLTENSKKEKELVPV